jgi:hypothetical protein
MIPPIITLRDLLREHGWGHLAAPIKPVTTLPVLGNARIVHRAPSDIGPAVVCLMSDGDWQPVWSAFPGDWT